MWAEGRKKMTPTPQYGKERLKKGKRVGNWRREGDVILRMVFFLIILLVDFAVLYPVLNVVAVSFSSYTGYAQYPMTIIPRDFSLEAYRQVIQHKGIWIGYRNTIMITVAGTLIGIVATVMAGYALSKKNLKGKKLIMPLILFTMFFSGGMLPQYFLMKGLGLLDTLAALFLPGCVSAYNLILVKNFIESLPESLLEAAQIDGASEPGILGRIVVPLSKPIISVIMLFLAVGYWNSYFNAILYSRSQSKWTVQLFLREIIMTAETLQKSTGGNLAEMGTGAIPAIMLQYATIVVVMVPILCVYPFIQKYFQGGIMLGAVKG